MYPSTVKRCSSQPARAATPAKPARRSSPAARSTDGEVARAGRRRSSSPIPNSSRSVVEDRVGREGAVVVEPRDVGQATRPAAGRDATSRRARGAVRDELEDERRERGVEAAVLERQLVGERDRPTRTGSRGRREPARRPRRRRPRASRVDASIPTTDGCGQPLERRERELAGAGADVERAHAPLGDDARPSSSSSSATAGARTGAHQRAYPAAIRS